MKRKRARGLFIAGTDTDAGKTHVAAMIVRALVASGKSVGVYKPVASGCRWEGNELVSDDALALWRAAGEPADLRRVCPQRFEAPLAPPTAARAEGREVDPALLREGLKHWKENHEFVVVEGVGGLMSPVGEDDYVADLADEFGYPLIIVARNALGVIHHTLAALVVAATFRDGIPVAGVILNQTTSSTDPSVALNADELSRHIVAPILANVAYGAEEFEQPIDWWGLGKKKAIR